MPRTPVVSPVAELMGIRPQKFTPEGEEPSYTVTVKPLHCHRNEHGTISGGYLALILDDTMGALICALTPSGVAVTSTITINFWKAVKQGTQLPGTELTVVAKVARLGSRLSTIDGVVLSGQKIVARATGEWYQKKDTSSSA